MLQPDPDNSYDIGSSGVGRLREIYTDYTWLLTSYLNERGGDTRTTREGLVRFCQCLPTMRAIIQRHILVEVDPEVRADLIAILLGA
jgi:hypothetical protein